MKKTHLFGAAALALVLAACGGSDTPAPAADTPEETTTPDTAAVEETEAPAEETTETAEAETEAAPEETEPEAEPETTEAAPEETDTAEATQGSDDGTVTVAGLTGDPQAGRRVFTQCMSCHAVQEGRNLAGPSLYGIIGREAGSVEGFRYSDANKNSGITWTPEIMFEYLEAPQQYIPGTIMAFPGLKKPQDRVDVIAYLKSVPES